MLRGSLCVIIMAELGTRCACVFKRHGIHLLRGRIITDQRLMCANLSYVAFFGLHPLAKCLPDYLSAVDSNTSAVH